MVTRWATWVGNGGYEGQEGNGHDEYIRRMIAHVVWAIDYMMGRGHAQHAG